MVSEGSVTDTSTVAVNGCVALRPPGSVALTRIVAAPSLAATSITKAPVTLAVTTCGADEDAVKDIASPSGSTNAPETSMFRVSSAAKVRFGRVAAGTGDRFVDTWVRSATIENWSAATLRFPGVVLRGSGRNVDRHDRRGRGA